MFIAKKDHGPYAYHFGCGSSCKTMKKIVYYPNDMK